MRQPKTRFHKDDVLARARRSQPSKLFKHGTSTHFYVLLKDGNAYKRTKVETGQLAAVAISDWNYTGTFSVGGFTEKLASLGFEVRGPRKKER